MNLMVKLRRGEGPFWSGLKAFVLRILRLHIPVVGVLRLLFGFLYGIHVFFRGLVATLTRFFWSESCFRIGTNAIIGAGTVVTRNVPADVVVAGNPARVFEQLAPTAPKGEQA